MKLCDILETQDYDVLPVTPFIQNTVDWLDANGTEWAKAMGGRSIIHGKYEDQDIFGLKSDNAIIAIGVFVDQGDFYELRLITNTTNKGGNFYPILSLLFSVKEYIGKPIIDYGSQSKLGQRFVQAVAKHGHFDLYWYNIRTGEKNKYDPTTDRQGVKPYRDTTQTEWRLLIESTPLGKEEFPREGLTPFGTPQDFFTEEYSVWLQSYNSSDCS
jgi:hypothetical protein